MAVAGTAKSHFVDDINRARKLVSHADTVRRSTLRDDIARSAWMMAVGAKIRYYFFTHSRPLEAAVAVWAD